MTRRPSPAQQRFNRYYNTDAVVRKAKQEGAPPEATRTLESLRRWHVAQALKRRREP